MINKAIKHVKDIIVRNYKYNVEDLNSAKFLIIYDNNSTLSKLLFEAYKSVLPAATHVDYYAQDPELIKDSLSNFKTGDLVILIQSSSFRMSNFRWRLELFNLGMAVIEHGHLGSNKDEEIENYLDSLEYQGEYYEKATNYLKPLLEKSGKIEVECEGTKLVYEGGMDAVKKNMGDFSGMKNVGCAFPIGEVFTEPLDLAKVNGEVMIYAFADENHKVVFPEKSFKLIVKEGCIEPVDAPIEFENVVKMLRTENEDGLIRVREFGLGLNHGLSKTKRLTDISAFERVAGLHISLGLKHDIYRKKVSDKKVQRFHVDIFPDIKSIKVDEVNIFDKGDFLIP